MTAAGGTTFATAVRMVDRVHRHTSYGWPMTQPSIASCLADDDVLLIRIRDRADRRPAFGAYHPQFSGRQTQQCVALVAADELGVSSRRAGDLATLARFHLDIVNDRAERHAAHRHRVSGLDIYPLAGRDRIPRPQPLRRQDVGKFAILVTDQRNKRGSVRIVFQTLDSRRHINLHALEVDDPVTLFVAAAAPPHRDPAGIVTTTLAPQSFGQSPDRLSLPH